MKLENIELITGQAGNGAIYNLMQDQPRKMVTVGVRGLYSFEVDKAQKAKKEYFNMKPSYEWVDNNQTKTKLAGTCAILVTNDYDEDFDFSNLLEAIKKTSIYGDCQSVGILVSEHSIVGEDDGEVIMPDARLICVVTL